MIMNKWEQRRVRLLDELSAQGKLTIAQVQNLLGISESTARRLIVELEQDNCLIRRFGGIQKIEPSSPRYSYDATSKTHSPQKEQIGRFAASLVESDDIIFLSGGSTVEAMAYALAKRLQNRELSNLSIITNSLVSAQALSFCLEVIMPGGIYRNDLQVLDGSLTEKYLRNMSFTKAFLGTVAISPSEGFMTADISTNSIHEIVLSRSSRFFVLADSSKFGKHSFTGYAPVNAAAGIITDSGLSPSLMEALSSQGAHIAISD